MPDVKDAVAVGILVLSVALFVPTLVDVTQDTKQDIAQIQNQSTEEFTGRLSVRVTDVSFSGSKATVEVSNSDTLESNETTLNVSQSEQLTVGGENVTVKLENVDLITGYEYATVTVTYRPTFGFGSGSKIFFQNMEIVIVLIGFIIVLGVLGVVSKP